MCVIARSFPVFSSVFFVYFLAYGCAPSAHTNGEPIRPTTPNGEGPSSGPPIGGSPEGAAPPTRQWSSRQSNHRRLATAHGGKGVGRMGDCDCASVFSDNKSLSGQWLLIWTRMENQSIQSSFVCLVISFWTMLLLLRLLCSLVVFF